MTAALPESLQPTAADIARDRQLAAEAQAILKEVEAKTGTRVKWNTQSYDSITYGPDGQHVARVTNGVSQMTREQEAVARAQSAANAEIIRMEGDLQRLIDQRDEITGYDQAGSPRYARHETDRQLLDKRITQLRLGLVNQKRLNERRWRNAAAPAVRRAEADRITAAELTKELEAKGRVQRIPGW